MAELTRQELITAVNALFPTNNNELITASNARSAFINFIESTYNKADDVINNNASVPEWNNSIPYPLNFIIAFNDKFWRSKQNNNTDHVPAENAYWTEVSKSTAGQNIDLGNYYLKQELQTAGQAQVALGNVVGFGTPSQCLAGLVSVSAGTATISEANITTTSILLSYCLKNGGSFSNVPFKFTASTGQMVISNGENADNGIISYFLLL